MASLLLAGCAAPSEGGSEEPPIDLILNADKDEIEPGEQLNLTVTVINEGDQPYTYEHPGCPPEAVRGDVDTGPGDAVDLYTYGQEPMYGTCAVKNVTLEPGQKVQTTLNWNGHTQDDRPQPHQGSAVSPGSYDLVVHLARADDGPTFQHSVTVEVTG